MGSLYRLISCPVAMATPTRPELERLPVDHNRKRFTRSNEVAPVTSKFKLMQARTDADVSQRKTCAHHRQLTRDRTRHCSEVSGGWRDNRHSLLPERSSGKGNAGPKQRARCGGRDLSGGCDKARPDRTLV